MDIKKFDFKKINFDDTFFSKDEITKKLIFSYQFLRSTHFTAQQKILPTIEKLLFKNSAHLGPQDRENFKKAFAELIQLLKKDSEFISQGYYPLSVLQPEAPWQHGKRFLQIIQDGVAISKRRQGKKSKEFSAEAEQYVADVPDYFKRNYHFQTDGYLSEKSAQLYEHQVEILFSGAADPMRRLLIPLLKKTLKSQNNPGWNDGQGLRFLELGAGTGRLTYFMKLAFPRAYFVCSDVSAPYLKIARQRLEKFSQVDFIQAPAEKIPFPEASFDCVYSCFLFHEIPEEVRDQVIEESRRLLNPGGLWGLVDSLQLSDNPDFDWALQRFPRDFHEPFYKKYTQKALEPWLSERQFALQDRQLGFFSKALVAQKPQL